MFGRHELATLFPKAAPAVLDGFVACEPALKTAGVLDQPNRLQFFLAQLGHESGGLTIREENLNYSAARLMAVWPSRFPTLASAQPYANNPRALANKVYGGRMGNTGPDDGWKYRGRGYIQLTGRDAYREVGRVAGLDLLNDPDLASDPQHATAIAAAYWTWKQVNGSCDAGDFVACTRKVNGGVNGISDRLAWLTRTQNTIVWPPDAPSVEQLKKAQRALQTRGLYDGSIDGVIGKHSGAGLKAFQAEQGLPQTGEPDEATLEALGV